MNTLSNLEFRLLNDWQRGFPLSEQPYADLAAQLGSDESSVIECLRSLKAGGHVSRIGAVFRPHVLGYSTLAAVACPAERLDDVARIIDAYPEVNHNYEREHRYSLWFVVTAPTRERVAEVLAGIHRQTGLKPLDLPMIEDYHIDLGFDLLHGVSGDVHDKSPFPPAPPPGGDGCAAARVREHPRHRIDIAALRNELEDADYCLAGALEGGLELAPRPYAVLAARCGLSEQACLTRIARLVELSIIRRFGVIVRHRELGYTANAMVVWDVPDHEVADVGRRLSERACVTLCYQRPRRLPDWGYNLFSMVHGQDRQTVLAELDALRRDLGLEHIACRPLFSRRRFKQCGARYSRLAKAA